MKKNKYEQDDKLQFNVKKHKYVYGRKKLVSVTTFIHQFFKGFDAKEVARKLAKIPKFRLEKKGVRYWLSLWKADSEHGTEVHEAIHKYLIKLDKQEHYKNNINLNSTNPGTFYREVTTDELLSITDTLSTRSQKKFIPAYAFLSTLSERNHNSAFIPEWKLFNKDLGMAGTIDLCILEGNKVHLYDWKTNKAIKETAYRKTEVGNPPLESLPDCNMSHYSLQLSFYAYLLELQGYEVGELVLVHLKEDESFTTYNINYNLYKPLILNMLEYKGDENEQKK